jgi:hypothetical protein
MQSTLKHPKSGWKPDVGSIPEMSNKSESAENIQGSVGSILPNKSESAEKVVQGSVGSIQEMPNKSESARKIVQERSGSITKKPNNSPWKIVQRKMGNGKIRVHPEPVPVPV